MAFGRQWCTVLPGGPLNLPLCCSRPFAGSAAAAAALKYIYIYTYLSLSLPTCLSGMEGQLQPPACFEILYSSSGPRRNQPQLLETTKGLGFLHGRNLEEPCMLGARAAPCELSIAGTHRAFARIAQGSEALDDFLFCGPSLVLGLVSVRGQTPSCNMLLKPRAVSMASLRRKRHENRINLKLQTFLWTSTEWCLLDLGNCFRGRGPGRLRPKPLALQPQRSCLRSGHARREWKLLLQA